MLYIVFLNVKKMIYIWKCNDCNMYWVWIVLVKKNCFWKIRDNKSHFIWRCHTSFCQWEKQTRSWYWRKKTCPYIPNKHNLDFLVCDLVCDLAISSSIESFLSSNIYTSNCGTQKILTYNSHVLIHIVTWGYKVK